MELIIRDAATAALEHLRAQVKNRHPVAEAAGLAVVQLAHRSFNDESVRAAPWPELAAATVERKLAEGTSTAILKRHGVLWRSFRVTEVTDEAVRVGTFVPYGIFHQFGTKSGLPARPILPITGTPEAPQLTPRALRNVRTAAAAALRRLLGQ